MVSNLFRGEDESMPAVQDRHHPVIVGVGQVTHREKITAEGLTAMDLAAGAIDACARDTGCPGILQRVDSLSVVNILTEHAESPVPKICEKAGIRPRVREETVIGGNHPQWLVNRAADKIMAGEVTVALLVGAEALYRDKSPWQHINWENLFSRYRNDPSILGEIRRGETPHEILHGADRASHIYPLFENALRRHLNMSPVEYRSFLRGYFERMANAAADNPYAWFPHGKQMGDITEPTGKNPIFNYPYTKYMNPIIAVNQAAAVLMTDTGTAEALGIPREKWVYLHGGADATDKWNISERICYHESPVVRFTAEAALESARLGVLDIDFFDLYSCFPCATLIAALEIGLSADSLPPLTITGGLSYFGGAGNNYTMHAIAHAVERLRWHPEEYGMVTGVGYFLTKYSVGIYSGLEPERVWSRQNRRAAQKKLDALESPVLCERPHGPATVETYTVLHDGPDGEAFPIIIARLDSGERCFATTEKGSGLPARMEREEFIGYRGFVTPGGPGPNILR